MSGISYDEALAALQELEERDKLTPFHVGDITLGLLAGLTGKPFADLVKKLANDIGRSLGYIRQRNAVAAAFPPELRYDIWGGEEPPPPVTWVHHRVVVDYVSDQKLYGYWIDRAIGEELSSRQLEELIRGERPDSTDDIIVSHDPAAAELHVLLSDADAAHVYDWGPGVLVATDDQGGGTVGIHIRLPEAAAGRKARLRRVR